PHFQTAPGVACSGITDTPAAGDLYWSCDAWKRGEPASNAPQVDSFEALDAIVALLKKDFPALARITVVGHSAGGPVTQRYAAATTEEDAAPHVPTRYIVANPSLYLYFDARRLTKTAVCSDAGDCVLDASSFQAPYYDAQACPSYDQYPYGMEAR